MSVVLFWIPACVQGGKTEEEIEADKIARLARQKSVSRESPPFLFLVDFPAAW